MSIIATLADAVANTEVKTCASDQVWNAATKTCDIVPTFFDNVASVIIIITSIIAFLGLGGLIVLMTIGAMAPKKLLSTSWSPEQEQSFVPYENHTQSSQSKAWVIALVSAIVVLVFAIGVKFGVEPQKQCESGKKLDKNGKCVDAQQVDREAARQAEDKAKDSTPKVEEKKEAPKAEEKKEAPKVEEKKEEKKDEPKAEEKKEEKK
jgi:hypothetical protein